MVMPFLVNPQRENARRDYSRKQRVEDDRLFARLARIPVSLTVWKDQAGAWHHTGNPTTEDLTEAVYVFRGGHGPHEVDAALAAELTAAGYEVIE